MLIWNLLQCLAAWAHKSLQKPVVSFIAKGKKTKGRDVKGEAQGDAWISSSCLRCWDVRSVAQLSLSLLWWRSGCLHPNHVQDVFTSAIMVHSIKAIPEQGHPHLSLSRWWCCKRQWHTAAAGPGTGDGGMAPVSAVPCFPPQAAANRKAQFTLVNLTCTLCSLAQSSQHRAAHMYFKLFYLSEVAGSIQTAFWGWCPAHANPLAVLCIVGADPHARDHSPA